jgi:hypothetical protein
MKNQVLRKSGDMSMMSELDLSIREMYDEGLKPVSIAGLLKCPLEMVYDVIESIEAEDGVEDIVSYDEMFGDSETYEGE